MPLSIFCAHPGRSSQRLSSLSLILPLSSLLVWAEALPGSVCRRLTGARCHRVGNITSGRRDPKIRVQHVLEQDAARAAPASFSTCEAQRRIERRKRRVERQVSTSSVIELTRLVVTHRHWGPSRSQTPYQYRATAGSSNQPRCCWQACLPQGRGRRSQSGEAQSRASLGREAVNVSAREGGGAPIDSRWLIRRATQFILCDGS